MKISIVCAILILFTAAGFGYHFAFQNNSLNKETLTTNGLPSNLEIEIFKIGRELKNSLKSDVINDNNIIQGISQFNEFLGNHTTQNYILKLVRDEDLINLAYDRIDILSGRCPEKRIRRLLFFLLSFIRENFIVGKSYVFQCRIQSLIDLCNECKDLNFYKLILSIIMMTVDFKEGGLCLNGAAQGLYSELIKYDYGLADWDLLSIFDIWADRMETISPEDKKSMCEFSNRLIEHRSQWDSTMKQYFCWFAKNVKCPSMQKINMNEILNSQECQEFLAETEKIIS
ncbi:hypothetical protein TRFO_30327 [Tritrichomonas foetus]|uniref:Uncharacterized protein n=1 Tax=Tritrichomonas foetus TaxID=1144522 RepID=A0A1J4JY99_9EUKA|nr:hypothetical protein TRFO_30327 [Tritrichomonas foetus]|eukprot:OHT02500.1 hypothetical protein TRFO_30327 [Tritrichomonas foetus]